uniref:FtsX-like permease family protein n=1 Tax=Streptomyces polyasparticus TaxID=2767826 RepID=UPI003F6838F7
MRAHRLLLVAALLAVLLTTSVLATLTAFSGAIGDASLRHSLLNRSAAPASLVVRTEVEPGERAAVEQQVEAGARRVFDGLPVSLLSYEKSGPYSLPLSLQAPGNRSEDPDLTHLGALDRSRIRLVDGAWPKAADKGPIQVALPEVAAKELDLAPGGPPVKLTDRLDGPSVTVQVTGVYQPKDSTEPYWQVDELNGRGVRKLDFTTYGPLLTDPATFAQSRVERGDSVWLARADFRGVQVDRIPELKRAAEQNSARFEKISGITSSLTADTQLPDVLERAERSLLVARSTLLIVALQLILLAGYALLLVARLLSSERAGETDLLVARGGSRGRVAWFSAAESLLLAVPAALIAPLLAGPLTRLLAGQGALARIGIELEVAPTLTVWLVALVVALGCAAAVIAPALSFTGMRRAVRAKSLPAPVRAGADVGLLVIAAVAYWQLDRQTSGGGVLSGDAEGNLGIDPLLVGAPALALLAGTILTLRLLPPAAKLGERRATKARGLPSALAGWQLSRRPLRGAGPVLLLVLAVAMGMLAIGQGASWDRSQEDQADFRAGTDLRVQGGRIPAAARDKVYSSIPGVKEAAPASRSSMELSGGRSAGILALDMRQAADGLLLRDDLGSPGELRDLLTTKPSSHGVRIPAGTQKIAFTVRIDSDKPTKSAPASVTAQVQDRYGNAQGLPLGKVPADGRTHTVGAELTATGPFTLSGFALDVTPSTGAAEKHRFAVTSVEADGAAITPPAQTTWLGIAQDANADPYAPPAALVVLKTGTDKSAPISASYDVPGASDGIALRGVEIDSARPDAPVPGAVVTERFAESSGAELGSSVDLPLGSAPLRVKVVKVVSDLPTVTANGGAVLVDLRAVNEALTADNRAALASGEWWLTAEPGKAGQVADELRSRADTDPEQVIARPEIAQELRDDPLGAGPQSALLAVALVAAALAAVGFAVSAAGSLRERAAEFSVLRALGTPQRQLARLIAAEQGVLIGLALLVGLALGAVLTRAVVPLIVLTGEASKPVPSVLVELPPVRVALLLAAVAVVPLLVVAAIALRRTDPVVSLRHEGGN